MTQKIYSMMMFTAVLLLLSSIQTTAQSVFWTEDFSSSTQYAVTLGAEGNDGSSDYFQRTDGANINKTYAQANGSFFAGQDIDDSGWAGSASPSQLTWTGIDISGKTNIEFSGLFGEAYDSPGDIDNSDYLYLEYRIDGGSWDTLIAFRNDGSTYNSNFYEDTNLDGIGDGALISNDTLNSFTKSISATGSLLDLRFTAAVNSGDEDFAIDEFQLSAAGSAPSVSYLWQEDFLNDLANIDTVNVTGPQSWVHDSYSGTTYAKMSGYSSGAVANEDWLISPAMDLTNYSSIYMVFNEAINYGGTIADEQEVYVSLDYNGDPTTATWTELTVTGRASGNSWNFTEVDTLDLSSYIGNANVTVAFKYTSTTANAATWEIDYAHIFGQTSTANPTVTLNPTSISGLNYIEGNGPSAIDSIMVSGTDIQDSIVLSSSADFEISMDAVTGFTDTLVIEDTTGSVSNVHIYVRLQDNLSSAVYTGNLKTMTTGMTSQNVSLQGEVTTPPNPNNLWYEEFNPDLAGIDTVSVLGAQKWYHDTYGVDNNCAVMSGYDNGAVHNEDWLISPAMDFSSAPAVKMAFSEAINYESNVADNQEVMISTDYNGDPAAATWTRLNVTGRSPGDSWSFVDVDTVDLSAYAGMNNVHVAFKYSSDTSSAGTWEIDYVKVFKDTSNPISEPANHVTNFMATAADSTSIDLSWTDAPNTNGYLIKVTSFHYDSISTPVDNVNESMDLNLDDGYGTILIGQNAQGLTVDSLDPNTVYYFKIYPFNASATLINYKTNGSVPQDTAKTDPSVTSIKDQVEMISLPYINSQQNLTFDLKIDEDVVARLYSLNGQLLHQTKVNGQHRRANIPVGNFNNRIFILSVEGQSSRNIFKVSR
ncbi:MAG: choice-of-anchor J domain-containing protein [Bacteroidales bacterium]